jgi:hypothetical protein
MDEITIHIFAASDGGYLYDIYTCSPKRCYAGGGDVESADGGLCTTTMQSALDMAASQALHLIERAEREEDTPEQPLPESIADDGSIACPYDHDHSAGGCEWHD